MPKFPSEHYQRKAQQQGYRSRAAYKLLNMDDKLSLLASARRIVELGCSPGGWTQVIRRRSAQALIIACDINPMIPIPGTKFIQGDFRHEKVQERMMSLLNHQPANLVLSDMSPNLSGQKIRDQAAMAELLWAGLIFSRQIIDPVTGGFLTKIFQGAEAEQFVREVRLLFNQVRILKPPASRNNSNENYLYMQGMKQ